MGNEVSYTLKDPSVFIGMTLQAFKCRTPLPSTYFACILYRSTHVNVISITAIIKARYSLADFHEIRKYFSSVT